MTDICENEESARIVRAVVDLARSLGMSTTAEGVETLAQWNRLKAAGCDEIQGFYVGRPGPLASTYAHFKPGRAVTHPKGQVPSAECSCHAPTACQD